MAKGRSHVEAERRADDRDFYREAFFVPERARWGYLHNEVHKQVGDGLNKALAALEQQNPPLEGVLQHIDFNRRVGTTTVSDKETTPHQPRTHPKRRTGAIRPGDHQPAVQPELRQGIAGPHRTVPLRLHPRKRQESRHHRVFCSAVEALHLHSPVELSGFTALLAAVTPRPATVTPQEIACRTWSC